MKRLEIRLPERGPLARAWSMPLGMDNRPSPLAPDGARLVYVLERQGVTQLYLRVIDQLQVTPIPAQRARSAPSFHLTATGSASSPETNSRKLRYRAATRSISAMPPIPTAEAGARTERSCLHPTRVVVPRGFRRPGECRSPSWSRTAAVRSRQPDILPGGKAAIVSNALPVERRRPLVRDRRVPTPGGTCRRRPVCAEWPPGFRAVRGVAGSTLRSREAGRDGTGDRDSRGRAHGCSGPGCYPRPRFPVTARWLRTRQLPTGAVRPVWVDRQGRPNPWECPRDRTETSVFSRRTKARHRHHRRS